MSRYRILFYRTSSDREVLLDFIRSFPKVEITKIHNDLDQLTQYGFQLLQTALVKKIHKNPPLFELRTKTIREIRLLFSLISKDMFIILHGFVKKTETIHIIG